MAFTIDKTTWRSPNFNDRPAGTDIWAIVIHTCEGSPPGNEQNSSLPWLCNPSSGVSCHHYVTREGVIYELVNPAKRAWHAGNSSLNGVGDCNTYSLGIEIEHKDNSAPYPDIQAEALSWLCRQLIAAYAIPEHGIDTHRKVAIPPGRKVDPTDWPDADFYAWRAMLYVENGAGIYLVRHTQAILEAPAPDGRVALGDTAHIVEGAEVDIDEVAHGGWAHLRNGIGFVPVSILTRLR